MIFKYAGFCETSNSSPKLALRPFRRDCSSIKFAQCSSVSPLERLFPQPSAVFHLTTAALHAYLVDEFGSIFTSPYLRCTGQCSGSLL